MLGADDIVNDNNVAVTAERFVARGLDGSVASKRACRAEVAKAKSIKIILFMGTPGLSDSSFRCFRKEVRSDICGSEVRLG